MEEFDFSEFTTEDHWWDVVFGDDMRFDQVQQPRVYDQSRWSVHKHMVVRRIGTDQYYEILWDEGATEYQDCQEPNFEVARVYPHIVTKTEYLLHPAD